jgi:spermidine synthase
MTAKNVLRSSVFSLGFTTLAAQIVFLREFLVVFSGNELSLGITLFSWLLWGAFGCLVLGHFSDKVKNKLRVFSFLQYSLLFILPLTMWGIRASKGLFFVSTGEIAGYLPMLLAAIAILGPFCVITAFLFSLSASINRMLLEKKMASVAGIYLFESFGAIAGGAFVSFLLMFFTDPVNIIFLLAFINAVNSLAVKRTSAGSGPYRPDRNVMAALVAVLALAALLGGGRVFRERSLSALWRGFDVVSSRDSVYGNVTVTKNGFQRTFFENGNGLYTVPDPLTAESSTHLAMLESAGVRDILLIGGGAGGMLNEVFKYPVASVDYVEIDPLIIKMARENLEEEFTLPLGDARLNIIYSDGRSWVRSTGKKYDCVILRLGDPYTAQINRFYTREFFGQVSDVLKEKGVLAFSLTASENYIGEELKDYLSSVHRTASSVFADVLVIPGDTAYFFASKAVGVLTKDHNEIAKRKDKYKISARFINDSYLFDRMSPERIGYAEKNISGVPGARVNTDFRPLAYSYAMKFWNSQLDPSPLKSVFSAVNARNAGISLVVILASVLAAVFIKKVPAERFRKAVLVSVSVGGGSAMSMQLLILLSFQVVYGTLYQKIGVVVTSFMAGFALGAWIVSRKDVFSARMFRRAQFMAVLVPLGLLWINTVFSGANGTMAYFIGSDILYPLAAILTGMIGGIQFPLASRMHMGSSNDVGRSFGAVYGLDLAGAAIGALFTSILLIPAIGITGAIIAVGCLNLVMLACLLL